jgi:hypothetical protein
VVNAGTESEIGAAFGAMSHMRVGGVHVGADPFFISRRDQIVSLAARAIGLELPPSLLARADEVIE